jgi:hypothetical protein
MRIPPELKIRVDLRDRIIERGYPRIRGIPPAPHANRRAASSDSGDWHRFRTMQRELRRKTAWNLCVRNRWMFRWTRALPRIAKYLVSTETSYMFTSALVTVLENISRHLLRGEE